MLYAGTQSGLLAFRPRMPVRFADHEVSALAQFDDPTSGLLAVIDGREVVSAGSHAREIVARVDGHEILDIASDGERVWLGTTGAHVYRVSEGRAILVEGFERTTDRDKWYTPWGAPPDTRSIALGSHGTVYANVHVGGIVRSRDAGQTWEPTIDIDADVHQVSVDPRNPRRVFAATARGFARSDDAGDSWRFDNAGLDRRYLRAVCVADDVILVTGSHGPHGGGGRVYRRPNHERFVPCQDGLPSEFDGNIDTHWLAARGNEVAFGAPDGSIYVSDDTGLTWTRLAAGLPSLRCLIFA